MDLSRRSLLLAAGTALGSKAVAASGDAAALAEAMKAVRDAVPKAASDPARPVYHFHPPAQWHNDPNGTLFYKGWHHLFYQFNPYGSEWGHMHWGHARSRDLIGWEHLPIALAPSKDKGEEHVFSGGAILGPDGRPRVFYTSIGNRPPEQWLAEPLDDDLIAWKKSPANPVLSLQSHGPLVVNEWRDPFPFREAGVDYMVCGGNLRPSGGQGAVQLYRAENAVMTAWKHLGPVFIHPDRAIWNIECPNLFRLGNKWVLLLSPEGPTQYFVGELDLKQPRFLPERQGILDPGKSYASNISVDPAGRTLLWLWGKTDTPRDKGWNSVMALPRVLSLSDIGDLRQSPLAEITGLREAVRETPDITLADGSRAVASGDCLDFECVIDVAAPATAGIRVRGAEILFDPKPGTLRVGGVTGFAGAGKRVKLRVLLDKRVVEVYANDGAAAIFQTVDASNGPLDVEIFARGQAAFRSLRVWKMKPAPMDPGPFS
ncbi:MAG: glycoside hydrolase family 32 protein [Acidobacteriota bacterium]